MTIDESIANEREKAEMYRFRIKNRLMTMLEIGECEREIEEHEQIAELLEELKARREADRTSDSKPFDVLLVQRYNKAIDDFVNSCKENTMCKTFGLREIDIEKIAEQLKAGGENVR